MSKERIESIKNHFYNSNLSRKDFTETYFQTYGFHCSSTFQRYLHKNDITSKERSKHTIENSKAPKSEIKTFDTHLLDNFGILDSIGKEYHSYIMPSDFKRIGVLSDIHFPFHSMEALVPAIKYLKEKEIDCLYLNGDIFDFYSISRHEKDPDMRDFKREVDMCRDFVQKLRDIFPNSALYYKMGNHEDRYQRSLQVQAEEFAQLHDLQFHVFFHLDRLGYQMIESWQGCEIGDLLVVHGHEGFGVGGVNPSQNVFNKYLCNTLCGHVHRTSNTMKKTAKKEFIHTYSTGCLTQLSPKYMPFSQHNHGFAYLEVKNNLTKVYNIVIKDGKIVN